ncbi:MAG: FTR1 family iron permease [Candidatus Thorarchaeota archaeon]|nr:MAG: hypothetical protein DRP09_04475 [Candidatus Thorarchaeota archaeon]RLI59744.1 MAG: hypothetical protein DRO87_02050 [Candidatus Thorarchaeota archaeon]
MIQVIITPIIVSFREGLEAALVLAVMLTYLRKTNRTDLTKYVTLGASIAVGVSIATAMIMNVVWGTVSGPVLGLFEGIVVLIAAVLLTTMIFWMWNAGDRISSAIEDSMKTKQAVAGGAGLAVLSFTLVLREGVELVLFSMALVIQDGAVVYIGLLIGLVLAAVLGFAVYHGSMRVSLGALFKWTSVFLILFAAGMIAYGIHELQETGLLLIGPSELWNINPPILPDGSYPLLHENGAIGGILKTLFGYNGNPSALEMAGYAGYLIVVGVYYYIKYHRSTETVPTSSGTPDGLVQ